MPVPRGRRSIRGISCKASAVSRAGRTRRPDTFCGTPGRKRPGQPPGRLRAQASHGTRSRTTKPFLHPGAKAPRRGPPRRWVFEDARDSCARSVGRSAAPGSLLAAGQPAARDSHPRAASSRAPLVSQARRPVKVHFRELAFGVGHALRASAATPKPRIPRSVLEGGRPLPLRFRTSSKSQRRRGLALAPSDF